MSIGGIKKINLTPENVLSKISEYDIFRYYMPNKDWVLNVPTLSPFREETNPSFSINNKKNHLKFIDFADNSKRGGCFDFVRMLYNLKSLNDALVMIDKDFELGFTSKKTLKYKKIVSEYKQPKLLEKKYSVIQVKVRNFTQEELRYWNEYYQDISDLKRENVYAIDKVFLNKELFSFPNNELKFGYLYENKWKIYRPFADRKSKWVPNNVPITAMDGKDDIINCNVAFINKSKKDYMVMKKIFPNNCAVQNEGVACFSQENVDYIKSNSKRQILSFDNDGPGVKNSKQITELLGFEYCNVPRKYIPEKITDWADLAKTRGLKTIENYLKKKKLL